MEKLRRERHMSPWQRRAAVGAAVVLASQVYFSLWVEGFRVSTAAVIYPLLLLTLMRESHRPDTGAVTGCFVVLCRVLADTVRGMGIGAALLLELPGGVFYLAYEGLLCLLVRDRRVAAGGRLWCSLMLCDFGANMVNFALSSRLKLRKIILHQHRHRSQ